MLTLEVVREYDLPFTSAVCSTIQCSNVREGMTSIYHETGTYYFLGTPNNLVSIRLQKLQASTDSGPGRCVTLQCTN